MDLEPDPGRNPPTASAMDVAMRWLAVRGHSRAEVESRLRKAGFPDEIAADTVARLSELGILSDRDLALAAVATGLRRNLSRARLQHDLERRGVPAADATWALDASGEQEPDAVRALRVAETWVRAHPSVAVEADLRAFRRLGGMLLRKGYDEELVDDVCRAVLGELGGSDDPWTTVGRGADGARID
jgi:regulatory protein